jgi:KaiC/GvpD/RAD55 family RecA-like ATPase
VSLLAPRYAKAGKTMFAMGAAVAAARDGWRVIYINAELDRNEAIMAVMRNCGGSIPEVIRENMKLVTPDFTFQPDDAVDRVRQAVQLGDERVLIVLDSINALVDLSSDGHGAQVIDYWSANSLWRNFAVRATKLSLGQLAFMVVSETNKDGAVKGRQLEYKSDMVVRIQRDREDDSVVSMDLRIPGQRAPVF